MKKLINLKYKNQFPWFLLKCFQENQKKNELAEPSTKINKKRNNAEAFEEDFQEEYEEECPIIDKYRKTNENIKEYGLIYFSYKK